MRPLSAVFALLIAAAAAQAQEPPDESRQELEKLKKEVAELKADRDRIARENEQLRKDMEALQKIGIEAAQELMRLRAALKNGTAPVAGPGPGPGPTHPPAPTDPEPEAGPETVLRGKVYAVDPKHNFIIVGLGEADGVKEGFRFEIVRREGEKLVRVAVAEFEKFIGESRAQSKLNIVEGEAKNVKYEDEAVAFRKAKVERVDRPGTEPTPAPGPKEFRIKGVAGDTFFLDYGQKDGAHQTDTVFVYRDNRLRAKLRIESVERDWCATKLVDGSKTGEIGVGDVVRLKEERTTTIGKVKFNDPRRGLIIDIGSQNQQVRVGQRFEVRRNGRKVGEIHLTSVDKFWSYAEPAPETKREDIQVEDIVESID